MSDSHTAGRPDQYEKLRYMGLHTKHAELDCRITATAECSPTLNARSSPQAKSSVHLLAHIFLCHQRLGVCGEHDMLNALLPDFSCRKSGPSPVHTEGCDTRPRSHSWLVPHRRSWRDLRGHRRCLREWQPTEMEI